MYRSREDFLRDVTQIVQNSTKFNGTCTVPECSYYYVLLLGSESVFTKITETMKEVSLEALNEVGMTTYCITENIGKFSYLEYLEEKNFGKWPNNGRWMLKIP